MGENLKIYEIFEKKRDMVIGDTADLLKKLVPENFKNSYLENVTIRDLYYNYDHLSVSISYEDSALFDSYLKWLKVLFSSYNLNFKGVVLSYEVMLEIFKKHFDNDLFEKGEKILNNSLKNLDFIKEEDIKSKYQDYFELFVDYSLKMDKESAYKLILDLIKMDLT